MAPPMNGMLKYFTSDRQCNPNGVPPRSNSVGASSSSAIVQALDKGKRPLEPNFPVTGSIVVAAVHNEARKRQRGYEGNRQFKPEWSSKFPWAEPVLEPNGECHRVRCIVCTAIVGSPHHILNKIDNLRKHEGLRKARSKLEIESTTIQVGDTYTIPDCKHWKNEKLWIARGLAPIVKPVSKVTDIREKRSKITQFIVILDLLMRGRPMTDYPLTHSLLTFLDIPELPKKHWCMGSAWEIAESINHIVHQKIQEVIRKADFFVVSADEVTSIDNEVWISIHIYVVQKNSRLPILLALKRVAGGCTSKNITNVIYDTLVIEGGLTVDQIAEKFVSFGADGASVFHGARTGVTARLVESRAPYMIGQHCVAHRTNLAVLCLSSLPIVSKIESLCASLYTYFSKSPKRHLTFMKLAEELNTSGNKILRNVKTRWISMLAPMIRVLEEYKTLLVAMSLCDTNVGKANLELLCDFETLVSLPCLMPLLETVNDLIKFAQSRHVYICDFIVGVKLCQAELYRKFIDPQTSFQRDSFQELWNIVGDSTHIVDFEWLTYLETHQEYLAMKILDNKYPSHWMGRSGSKNPLAREDFAAIVAAVKEQCREVAQLLMTELDKRFLDADLMNALGVVFPQYWMDPNCHEMFPLHLEIIVKAFGTGKFTATGVGRDKVTTLVDEPLSRRLLESQMSVFKSTMISNSKKVMEAKIDSNPLTILWNTIATCGLLNERISEWFKVAEIAIVTVIGSVEDERTFSTLTWIKSKVKNCLGSHLDCSLRLYSQSFFSLASFPYEEAIKHWEAGRQRRGVGY